MLNRSKKCPNSKQICFQWENFKTSYYWKWPKFKKAVLIFKSQYQMQDNSMSFAEQWNLTQCFTKGEFKKKKTSYTSTSRLQNNEHLT